MKNTHPLDDDSIALRRAALNRRAQILYHRQTPDILDVVLARLAKDIFPPRKSDESGR